MKNRKIALALLGASAILGTSSAFATGTLPSTGNGELVLFVTDQGTGNSYAKNLGVFLNDLVSDSAVSTTAAGTISYSLTAVDLSADTNFTSLISGATGDVVWGIMGGDTSGNNLQTNPRRWVQTSGASSAPSFTNSGVSATAGDFNTYLNSVNGNLTGASVAGTGASGGMYGIAGTAGAAAQNGFTGGQSTAGLLGSTMSFYMFTSSNTSGTPIGGSGNLAKVYQFTDLTLSSTGLTAVPVPAAAWLLGSGLLGMLGVGRRRAVKAA